MLKLHGSRTDWASAILSGDSQRRFRDAYPLLCNQLDINLRTHPLLFVGCSTRDPRFLDWLRSLSEAERRRLHPARVPITERSWQRIPEPDRELLGTANVTPITVPTHADIGVVLQGVADKLAP